MFVKSETIVNTVKHKDFSMVVNDSKSLYHQSQVNRKDGTDFSYFCLQLVDRTLVSVMSSA